MPPHCLPRTAQSLTRPSRLMPGGWTCRPTPCLSRTRPSLRAQCRHASARVPGRILRGRHLGPTRQDAHQTFRLRKEETATQLPLSPLLDPVVVAERARFEQTKERPRFARFTPLQKKLWMNPFAHALASPVRQCRATTVLLPAAFLVSLHARPHPTTKDPWLLPVSLTTEKKHLGPPFHFVARHLIAAHMGKKKAWERALYARMSEKLGGHNLKKMVWREDMPDFLTDIMRKRVGSKLSWNFGFRGRLIPVASPRTEDIEGVEDVSCVLIFRSLCTRADDLQKQVDANTIELEKWSNYFTKSFASKLDPHAAPDVTHLSPHWYTGPVISRLQPRVQFPELEFHTTVWRGKKVAVYSLTDLLGEDKAQELIQGSQYAGERCVVIKAARHNVPVEILLMQLQAYIAQPGP
ncbi:N-acetyltransferase [Alternaria panax]|uniref:N-acetyltransferase n=1 Tax=Alternaria panax TaxID=48097 RepID=A0AAD4NQU2_9PLEO|nr:N-acetyltransferase [Alternaria panax]